MLTQSPAAGPNIVDTAEWRERMRSFFSARHSAGYWAFNFEKAWSKFKRGVQQELLLADQVGHWMDLRGARVLVIGSYLGMEAIAYALRGAKVTGIDLDEDAMAVSRELARRYGVEIDVRSADAADTDFPDGSFDYVSCAQVLEHVPPADQPRLLAEIWRLCKPGGLFWLDTPNQWAYKDHHDTGLPFIHWLPRRLKVPLARLLGRAATEREPAFGNRPVYLHYYMSYFGVVRTLKRFGTFDILSRYRGYADIGHYKEAKRRQGKKGLGFALKTTFLRGALKVWNWNWFTGIKLMIRKKADYASR